MKPTEIITADAQAKGVDPQPVLQIIAKTLKAKKGDNQTAEKLDKEGGSDNILSDILDAFGGLGKGIQWVTVKPINFQLLSCTRFPSLISAPTDCTQPSVDFPLCQDTNETPRRSCLTS